jgi:hypothetical protein
MDRGAMNVCDARCKVESVSMIYLMGDASERHNAREFSRNVARFCGGVMEIFLTAIAFFVILGVIIALMDT